MTHGNDSWNPDEWVDQHGDYLYRFALSRLRNNSDAEEAVQDTLLSAWKNRGNYQAKATERTWLTGILKNKIYDRFRSRVRDSARIDDSIDASELDSLFDSAGHGVIPSSGWTGNATNEVEKGEFWIIFDECVSHLPERISTVFVMRELDRTDSNEICKVLGITPTNYWVRLHRARLKLRECLELNWFQRQDL